MTSVVVFDYGFGNVRSMVRALANLGLDTTLTSDYRQALEADGMVVPGVGAFAACMTGLREVSGDRVILDRLRAGRPVLGVCVGEQIMFERGNEHADTTEGLGLIGGTVDLLDADVVPHMGWDTVEAPAIGVRAARRRGERTVLFCALLRGDERHREGSERRAGRSGRRRAYHVVHVWP